MSSWFVYLLLCEDESLYCGMTNNLNRRLLQHKGILPGGARYTKSHPPVSLAASAPCKSKSDALKLEYAVKQLPKDKKIPFLLALKESLECSAPVASTFPRIHEKYPTAQATEYNVNGQRPANTTPRLKKASDNAL